MKKILKNYLNQISGRTEGFILSWNLLEIPKPTIEFIGKVMKN